MPKLLRIDQQKRILFESPELGRCLLHSPYDSELVELLKKKPGSEWLPKKKRWLVPEERVGEISIWAAGKGIAAEIQPRKQRPIVGDLPPGMFSYQMRDAERAAEMGYFLFLYETGLGKALKMDAPILTPAGWKLMRNVHAGDYVIGSDGEATKVVGVYPQGEQQVYRVWFSDATYCDCSEDHLWQVHSSTQKSRGQHEVLSVRQMLERGVKAPGGCTRFYIPLVEPIKFEKSTLPIPPYTMGILLGDGCLSTDNGVRIACASEEVRHRVRTELSCDLGITENTNGFSIVRAAQSGANSYLDKLRDLGLSGCRAEEKYIPEVYLRTSVEDRIDLLQGLMDTDGYIDATGSILQYYTTSDRLAADVMELVRSLGGVVYWSVKDAPVYTYNGEQRTGQPCHVITLNLPREIYPFFISRKVNRYQQRMDRKQWGLSKHIVEIEKLDETAEMQCIKVAALDGLFVTNDYIVTHNSVAALGACRLVAAQRILIICPKVVRTAWRTQFQKWWPERVEDIQIIKTGKDVVEKPIVICSYGMAKAIATMDEVDSLIIDEVHYIKSGDAERTAVVRAIAKASPGALRLGLTATPISNRPKDLFYQVDTLCPGRFGKWFFFVQRYCITEHNGYGQVVKGAAVEYAQELSERLAFFSQVVTKKEVAHLLPPMTIESLWIDIDDRMARQLSNVTQGSSNIKQLVTRTNGALIEPKVEAVIEIALNGETPLCIFTHLRATARTIAERLPGSVLITGEIVSAEKRLKLIAELLDRDPGQGRKILVATMQSLNEGIDLTPFTHTIFAEQHYSPTVMQQAVGRFHRLSSKDPSYIQIVGAIGTADEKVALSLVAKLEDINRILKEGTLSAEQMRAALSRESSGEEWKARLERELGLQLDGSAYGTVHDYLSDDE